MKIKQTKNFTLPQLIEWAIENDIKVRVFESNPNFDGVTYRLGFDKSGDLYFEESLAPTLLFTVEVEEEITEDTVFNNLIHVYKDPKNSLYTESHENVSINDIKSEDYLKTTGIYILNEDSTLTLVWYNGKLIEE